MQQIVLSPKIWLEGFVTSWKMKVVVANHLTVVNPQSKKKIEIIQTEKPSFSSEAKQKPISSNPFFKSYV